MLLRFKLRKADEERFHITIFLDNEELAEADLPASLEELKSSFHQWQEAYLGLEDVALRISSSSEPPKRRFSRDEIARFAESFRLSLNKWLGGDGDPKWQNAREELVKRLSKRSEDEIRIFIDVKESDLRRFPWQEWEFLHLHCPDAEVALYNKYMDPSKVLPSSESVKVLVVVGDNQGIVEGVREDLKAIKELEQQNKGAFKVLEQPTPHELLEELRSQIYEIFIFTGHSGSDDNKEIGWIGLSETDSLRINDLKLALREAINKRLQICIFNSCDGLGLAKQLAELKLPLSIVMREPVPDNVAARFLGVFLENYSNGQSFFKSFREARHRLEGFNAQYPGVCWLPTVYIGILVEPPTWQQLGGSEIIRPTAPAPPAPPSPPIWRRRLLPGVLAGASCILLASWVAPHLRSTIKDVQPPQSSGTVRYGGSTSAVPIDKNIQPAIHNAFPNLTFKTGFSNTGNRLEQMLNPNNSERPQFLFVSSSVNKFNTKLEQIADDAIAVVVNPDLRVTSLTLNDLTKIITGEVRDWQQIIPGVKSIPIRVYHRPNSGTEDFLKGALSLNPTQKDKAFKGNQFIPITDSQSPLTKAKNKVQDDPGGIYFVTASESVDQCEFKPVPIKKNSNTEPIAPYEGTLTPRDSYCAKVPLENRNKVNIAAIRDKSYPLIRPIYIVLRTDDATAKAWGEFYLKVLRTDEGRELTLKAGFLPQQP